MFALIALPFAFYLILRGDYSFRDPWILATVVGSLAVFLISGGRQVFLGSIIIVVGMMALQIVRGRGRAAVAAAAVACLGIGTYVGIREYVLPAAQVSLEEASDIPQIWRERNPVDRFQTLLVRRTYATARRGGFALVWDRITSAPFGAGLGRTGSAASALGGALERDQLDTSLQERFGFQDNYFAAMIVETGIPGALLMTAILVGLGLRAARLSRRAPTVEDSALGSLVAGYMLAIFIMSWGSQPLLANPTMAFFWFLGGMAARRLYEVEAGRAEEVVVHDEGVALMPSPSLV